MNLPKFLDAATRNVATNSIDVYQKFISPHKGFSCAHRLLYGKESCSSFFNRIIIEQGVLAALKISSSRFQACREANLMLRNSDCLQANVQQGNQELEEPKRRQKKQEDLNIPDCDTCADVASVVPDCSGFDCGIPDLSGLDCGGCDGKDLSSCDCAGSDCGSCGN
jgi:putative component of membrane protein insertase Oxa1/YidC/SpoIIIJ protein YidD